MQLPWSQTFALIRTLEVIAAHQLKLCSGKSPYFENLPHQAVLKVHTATNHIKSTSLKADSPSVKRPHTRAQQSASLCQYVSVGLHPIRSHKSFRVKKKCFIFLLLFVLLWNFVYFLTLDRIVDSLFPYPFISFICYFPFLRLLHIKRQLVFFYYYCYIYQVSITFNGILHAAQYRKKGI